MNSIKIVFSLLERSQKIKFIKIFALILIMTILETFGIALVIPAIKVLISENFYKTINQFIEPLTDYNLGKIELIKYGLIFILFFFIMKFIFSSYTFYNQLKFKFDVLVLSSKKLYKGYLCQDYELYTQRNSSLLIRNVTILVDKYCALLENCFTILTDFALFLGVLGLLLYVDFSATLTIFFLFTLISLVFYYSTKKKFNYWGKLAVNYEFYKFKFLYEGLASLKDIRISNNENFFTNNYVKYVFKHGKITLIRNFIKILPKNTYEIIAILGLVILSLSTLNSGRGLDAFLPTAGLFAVAAFKILPSGNRLLLAFQNLRFDYEGLKILKREIDQVYNNDINQEIIQKNEIVLKNSILIKDISFKYKSRDNKILNNISLEIKNKQTIGIIGQSGSGKSTLMDLIIGLFKPTSGIISCDGVDIQTNLRSWYQNIGYVPQNIQLFDNSIKMNIAFGIDESEVNIDRVNECLKMSKLDNWVQSLENGIATIVGDKGIRISGGQRQRIGIARALYNNPKILFFDESTSSLDLKTEDELMKEVNSLLKDITKIVISHRMDTLKNCDQIYLIEDGQISQTGTYQEMLKFKYESK
jgi:ABC-type bacteriocin/lantibiotic exporter with double-glycine peptidase domain